jgi:ribonuclease E
MQSNKSSKKARQIAEEPAAITPETKPVKAEAKAKPLTAKSSKPKKAEGEIASAKRHKSAQPSVPEGPAVEAIAAVQSVPAAEPASIAEPAPVGAAGPVMETAAVAESNSVVESAPAVQAAAVVASVPVAETAAAVETAPVIEVAPIGEEAVPEEAAVVESAAPIAEAAPRTMAAAAGIPGSAIIDSVGAVTLSEPHPVSDTISSVEPAPARVVTQEEIGRLAHSYWIARGCHGGSPDEDWLRAERELLGRS